MQVPKAVGAGFIAFALLLIGVNVALMKQDLRLAGLNKAYEANLHLSVGDSVPPLSGVNLTGSPATVEYMPGGPKTLLLVFSRSCGVCGLNWPAWQRVLSQSDPQRVRAIGVSLESTGLSSLYLAQVGLTRTEMIVFPNVGSIIAYRFRYTPQTILIGSDGRVEGIWSGALQPQQMEEIKQRSVSAVVRSIPEEEKGALSP